MLHRKKTTVRKYPLEAWKTSGGYYIKRKGVFNMSTTRVQFLRQYDVNIDGEFRDQQIAELYIMNQRGFNIKAGNGLYLHPTSNLTALLQKSAVAKDKWLVSFR